MGFVCAPWSRVPGADRTIGTDGAHIVVALASLYVLLRVFKPAKKK